MNVLKKKSKNKDVINALNEKEYKCVSLRAITNEIMKENNEKKLKELVEEINHHLTDLRSLRIEDDDTIEERRANLIGNFEKCLVKIIKPVSKEILEKLKKQQDDIKEFSVAVIEKDDAEELRLLAERIDRLMQVIKNLPEVINGTASEQLKLIIAQYEALYGTVRAHFNSARISRPISQMEFSKLFGPQSKSEKTENTTDCPVPTNEMQEKLMQIRQKRTELMESLNQSPSTTSVANAKSESFSGFKAEHRSSGQAFNSSVSQSNSFKSNSQRTPIPIRKLFNSCVSSSSANKDSIEDLTGEFNSPFEQQLKGFKLKPTQFSERYMEFRKNEENVVENSPNLNKNPRKQAINVASPKLPSGVNENIELRNNRKKPIVSPRTKMPDRQEKPAAEENIMPHRISDSLTSQADRKTPIIENPKIEPLSKYTLNKSLNSKKHSSEDIISIRNDSRSATPEPSPNRISFSTFRSSTDSIQNLPSENIYENIIVRNSDKNQKEADKESSVDSEDKDIVKGFLQEIFKIKETVDAFKGFKYDDKYLKIDKKLAKYLVELNDINAGFSGEDMGKSELLMILKTVADALDSRVRKNELILRNILEEQVEFIAKKHGLIQRSA